MQAVLHALCRVGFDCEGATIEQQWHALLDNLGVEPEPEYQRCFPRQILGLIVENTLRGVRGIGWRIASAATADPVHPALDQAWQEFWESSAEYSSDKKALIEKLRKSSAMALA